MLSFLNKNASELIPTFIDYIKSIDIDPKQLFSGNLNTQCIYMIMYLASNHKIDTYISGMGLVSMKVTYPNDSNYTKDGILILRKPIDIYNTSKLFEYVKDLILYIHNNPF